MPSFDIVCEVDQHEVANAVDQANREVSNRFDFKGSDAHYTAKDTQITMHAEVDFQLQQMLDILKQKLTKRGVDIAHLQPGEPELQHKKATQNITLQQGIDQPTAKKISKCIKDNKLKVQSAIQGDQVRITGKKRDDLQAAIALLKENILDLPLQFNNFRD